MSGTRNGLGDVLVLGAGLTGLSVAHHLRAAGHERVTVFEKESEPGGLVRTLRVGDYRFDYTGHFLHLRDPDVRRLVDRCCGDGLDTVTRNAWIHSNDVFTPYPFQTNLHGQPLEVVRECLLGYIAARAGDAERDPEAQPPSFEQWILDGVGAGIAKHFMLPYNRKLWGVPLAEMTTDWMNRFMPPTPLDKVVAGALGLRDDGAGYNARFLYPREGGIQFLSERLAALAGALELGRTAVRIDARARTVEFDDGAIAAYEHLVSSLPLPALCDLIADLPAEVRSARARLRATSVWALMLGVSSDHTEGRHWVYVPEEDYPFYRAGCFSNVSAAMAPPGHAAIWVERAYNDDQPLDADRARADSIAGLIRMGWLRDQSEIVEETQLRIPGAYVIYDRHHAEATRTIHTYLRDLGIQSSGRYGQWNYSSMEDAIIDGRDAARRLLGESVIESTAPEAGLK